MKISIIIPTFQEAGTIEKLITYLHGLAATEHVEEIIVADGGSTDATLIRAQQAGARPVLCARKGRAAQMNAGASVAKGDILYFLHADSFPPADFARDIIQAVHLGIRSGCYRLAFDHPHWFLKANAWFTRFNLTAVRFGDQSLFVTKALFDAIGGFDENLILMEDQEIIARIRRNGTFTVLPGAVTTSARKYLENGIFKLQGVFFIIYFLYQLGLPQERLLHVYKTLITQSKL